MSLCSHGLLHRNRRCFSSRAAFLTHPYNVTTVLLIAVQYVTYHNVQCKRVLGRYLFRISGSHQLSVTEVLRVFPQSVRLIVDSTASLNSTRSHPRKLNLFHVRKYRPPSNGGITWEPESRH